MTLYPTRTVLILLAGASLAACSTYTPFEGSASGPARPAFAVQADSALAAGQPAAAVQAPSQEPSRAETAPPARQAAPELVETRALDAPAARRDETPPARPAATQTYAAASRAAAPSSSPASTGGKSTVTGRVVDAEGPARTHIVKRGDNLDAIARELGVSRQELAEQNGLKPPYRLHPGDALTGPSTEAKAYVVGQGDTLTAVAKRFSVTAQALAQANDLETGARLAPGRKLILPAGFKDKGPVRGAPVSTEYNPTPPRGEPTAAEAAPERSAGHTAVSGKLVAVTGKAGSYKVRKGDTVESLADKFDMTQKELIAANGLKRPYRLRIGQVLKGPPEEHKAYVPGEGDTLALIAKRFSVSASALADANDMDTTDKVVPGHRLTLPAGFKDKGPVKVAGGSAPTPTEAPPSRAGRRGHAEPTPAPAEEPAERTGARASVTGKVVNVATGPISYKVKKGDTVETIADDFDITQKELIKTNRLKAPYRLRAGQVLKGPPDEYQAYVPVEGDTLALIARRFGVTAKALAAENDMKVTAEVRPGRKLALPEGFHDKGPIRETTRGGPETTPAAQPAVRTPSAPQPYSPGPQPYIPSRPQPYSPPVRPATPAPQAPTTGALSDAQISALGRGRFQWPLNGPSEVLSDFGPKGTGKRNDGIDIHANPGDVVRAAADGDVVYAGDQVPGFGNLVLVRHADGWVTAYGNLAKVEVKMQQKVVQGQPLGPAGQTGGVAAPQLHFEVRYAPSPTERARPVDPKLVLPR